MTDQQQRRGRQSRHRSYTPPASPSFHSMSSNSRTGSEHGSASSVPRHPVQSMQAAFEESIQDLEVDTSSNSGWTSSQDSRKWKSRHHHSEYHRLRKVVSQIAFGIHLLHARLAKSDPEVVRILQSHMNDMDYFVHSTTNDFDLAKSDIGQRLKHLRIPLDTCRASEVFDEMLQNREFRLEIVKGNENVEYVISRTTLAMNNALVDVREGLSAVDELAKYLLCLEKGWKNTNLIRVYAAMTLNVEHWFRGLVALQSKGAGLKEDLDQLRRVVREIEDRTSIASRKNRSSYVLTTKQSCPALTANINKPLPTPPKQDSLLTAIDIRTVRRPRSQSPQKRNRPVITLAEGKLPEKRKSPVITLAEEKKPPGRTISQRLLRHSRSRDLPEEQLEYEKQKRVSRVRARPTPEMWPEPLSARSGELMNNEVEDFVFNPDKAEVKRKATREKGSKESCTVM